ncbi:hypothetical protein, partial [Tenacibaculum maritimum]|uniref:hypothetical protein n=1 Tax=Tenacibaculum maritimum TaxID=107401 RepID=UPI001F15BCD1
IKKRSWLWKSYILWYRKYGDAECFNHICREFEKDFEIKLETNLVKLQIQHKDTICTKIKAFKNSIYDIKQCENKKRSHRFNREISYKSGCFVK